MSLLQRDIGYCKDAVSFLSGGYGAPQVNIDVHVPYETAGMHIQEPECPTFRRVAIDMLTAEDRQAIEAIIVRRRKKLEEECVAIEKKYEGVGGATGGA